MIPDVERAEDLRMDTAPMRAAVLGRAVRVVLVTVLAVLVAGVILFIMPKTYESRATLVVEPRQAVVQGSGAEPVDMAALTASHVEAMRSRDLLLEVVDAKGLRAVPEFADAGISPFGLLMRLLGRGIDTSLDETVLGNFADRLTVSGDAEAATLTVAVRSADPRLAADLADAVADAYVKRRAAQWRTATTDATVWLQQEIDRLRGTVSDAESAVAEYRVEHGLFVGAGATPVSDQQLSTVSDQIASAQERRNAAEARAQMIRTLVDAGQPLDGVADVQRSVVIQGLLSTKSGLQAELAQRSTTLLSNHPTIKALKAQIGELDRQITGEARKVADSLAAEARVEADLEQRLRDELSRAKLLAGDAAKGGVTLDGLEREAKAQRDLLETYLARYSDIVSRSAASAPLPDVRIAGAAVVPSDPASPAFVPTLAMVALAAAGLQIGAILIGEAGTTVPGRIQPHKNAAEPLRSEQDEAIEHAVEAALFDADDPAGQGGTAEALDDEAMAVPAIEVAEPEPDTEPDLFADFDAVKPEAGADEPPVAAGVADPDDQEGEMTFDELIGLKPADAPQPEREATRPDDGHFGADDDMAALSAAVTAHQLRTVLLATVGDSGASVPVVERLLEDTIMAELSAVVVDAGSGDVSPVPGLTDLAAGEADYGEVVQRAGENLAEVQWGRRETIDRRSSRPLTLVEALGDIYHVVIVDTGRVGMASSLPLFTGARATVVLVADAGANPVQVGQARRDIAALGFAVGRVVTLPSLQADVA